MKGVLNNELKIIDNKLGNIFHCLKKSSDGFNGFGEAYFTEVLNKKVKGWNMHKRMTVNLTVISGKVLFVVYDDRDSSSTYKKFYSSILSKKNYKRLTIQPGLWFAMKGLKKNNIVLNIGDLEHDPNELIKKEIDKIKYKW